MSETKIKITKDSVQETLLIPLFARKVCSDAFPELFYDETSIEILDRIDYNFQKKEKLMKSQIGLFGALEVAQRQYDLEQEVKDYLKEHPRAAVVNLGCGLDTTFWKVDNGLCRGYNLDLADVIAVRNELIGVREREENLVCDLNDYSWFDKIDDSDGAVFFASGVFYYFQEEQVRSLFSAMAAHFKKGKISFDACNEKGLKMMLKTWIKEAGIKDIGAFFSVRNAQKELSSCSDFFESVRAKSYMIGYRDIRSYVGWFHRLLIAMCDKYFDMQIITIRFK